MILYVAAEDEAKTLSILGDQGEIVFRIGEIVTSPKQPETLYKG